MLVLSRETVRSLEAKADGLGKSVIVIGEGDTAVKVHIIRTRGNIVSVGVEALPEIPVKRGELLDGDGPTSAEPAA